MHAERRRVSERIPSVVSHVQVVTTLMRPLRTHTRIAYPLSVTASTSSLRQTTHKRTTCRRYSTPTCRHAPQHLPRQPFAEPVKYTYTDGRGSSAVLIRGSAENERGIESKNSVPQDPDPDQEPDRPGEISDQEWEMRTGINVSPSSLRFH